MADFGQQLLGGLPVVTRTYLAGAFLTTAACAMDIVSPFSLYFSIPLIFNKYQYWRLLTNFLFFEARFSLDFVFRMYFLVRYSRLLEENSFRGRTADFVYMLLFGAVFMLLVAPVIRLQFLGSSLTFMMVYVWARRNPFIRMNLFGLFNFNAPYLPWVLLGLSTLLGHSAVVDVLGIAVGHIYYFLEDVYPRMTPNRTRLLQTPHLLKMLFDEQDEVIIADEDEDEGVVLAD